MRQFTKSINHVSANAKIPFLFFNLFIGSFQNTGATSIILGKPLGKAPSGIRIVKIYSDKIEHEYFGLEELPDSVVFH